MKTIHRLPPIVQIYDYSKIIEYYKKNSGFIFSSSEIVRTETIENHLELQITCDKMPDKLFINGKEIKLTSSQRSISD